MNDENERVAAETADPARQALLDEARTAVSEQLGQIDKIDDAAVRTVRITLVVLGILVSGPQLAPFPNLGVAGAIGTWALVGTLLTAVTVYGTSRVFVGSAPDELAVEYTESPLVENTYIEILAEYDKGIVDNRRTLLANGFILSVARALLAVAVLGIVYGLVSASPPATAASIDGQSLILLFALRSVTMATEDDPDTGSVSKPVTIYTGPKRIADLKIALGKRLE